MQLIRSAFSRLANVSLTSLRSINVGMNENRDKRNAKWRIIPIILMLWLFIVLCLPSQWSLIEDYGAFSLLGVLGAIFANSTGAGGGVVFIPAFNHFAFTESQAVATSFAIQCFGMTAGALTWWYFYRVEKTELRLWQGFKRVIVVTSLASIIGLWGVYAGGIDAPASLQLNFSWFSLILGAFIILTIYMVKPSRDVSQLNATDYTCLVLIGLFGGAITAWLSVGVGELLAIYLLLRRFDMAMAVAAAVVVSACTVWSAIGYHTLHQFNVYWQVVLFAGPGAVLGGLVAKYVVTHLSAIRLKLFFLFGY